MRTVSFDLFEGIPPPVAEAMVRALTVAEYAAGETLLREGELNNRLVIVEAGELEAWKGPLRSTAGVTLARLTPGACFGEISADHATPSSATLVAISACRVRWLTFADLPADAALRETIALNLSRQLVRQLSAAHTAIHDKHEREAGAVRVTAAASAFVTRMLVALATYTLSLPLLAAVTPLLPSNSLISFFFIAAFAWLVVNYMGRHPEVRHQHWFMTLEQWPSKLARGLVWTIPPLLVFLAIKLSFMAARPGMPFFEPMMAIRPGAPMNLPLWTAFAVVYTGLCFAQEFVRCAVQGTLEAINPAPALGGHWKAILISDLVFSSIHVHLGGSFAAQAFIGGLFFGYEFHRERSYLAVAVSHALVGLVAVFIVGIPR